MTGATPGGSSTPDAGAPVPRDGAPARRGALHVGRRAAVLGILLAAGLQIAAASGVWASAPVSGVLGGESVAVTGLRIAPALTGLALVQLAGALLLGLAGPVLARVVALVVALCAAGGALLAATPDARPALEEAAAQAVGVPRLAGEPAGTVLPWLAVAAALCAMIVAVAALRSAGAWTRTGRRFERPAASTASAAPVATTASAAPGSAPAAPDPPAAGEAPSTAPSDRAGQRTPASASDRARADRARALDDWEALERGEDPSDPGSPPGNAPRAG